MDMKALAQEREARRGAGAAGATGAAVPPRQLSNPWSKPQPATQASSSASSTDHRARELRGWCVAAAPACVLHTAPASTHCMDKICPSGTSAPHLM
jgi:hypothetical protein